MEDGSVRYNGSCKYSHERRSAEYDHELQSALAKNEKHKTKIQGCLACEQGISVSLGRKHTVDCRQTVLPPLETDNLRTVKFNADGKSLKRHRHEDDEDNRDPKRVRCTHKQPVKRADSEGTDDKDTDAKRAKLCDTPSSSFSSHEFAPMLHVSSGVDESAETREIVTKKPCVDDTMEISAIETRTNAKSAVGRALDTANKTLHRVLDECPLESEAVTNAAELNSIKDKRVYTEMPRELRTFFAVSGC